MTGLHGAQHSERRSFRQKPRGIQISEEKEEKEVEASGSVDK
jgi:hypothetical protein